MSYIVISPDDLGAIDEPDLAQLHQILAKIDATEYTCKVIGDDRFEVLVITSAGVLSLRLGKKGVQIEIVD